MTASASSVASDTSRWSAHDLTLLRVDDGVARAVHTFSQPIVAHASAGDARVYVATSRTLWIVDAAAAPARASWQSDIHDPAIVALHLDAARGNLWVVRASDVLRLDVLDAFRETLRFPTGERVIAALDREQGALWLLGEAALTAVDGQGQVIAAIDVPHDVSRDATALRVEPAGVAHIVNAEGATRLDLASGRIDRLDPPIHEPADPSALHPALEISADPSSAPPALVIEVHAGCGTGCGDDHRYRERAVVAARVGEVDVTSRLVPGVPGRWSLSLTPADTGSAARLTVEAVDAYGNRASAQVDPASLLARRAKANALPTVRITAPLTGASAVAPATFTIAAAAADTDGTVSKVEFYRNGVLLGTDATSPYTWSWTNVAVGTYSLTAKAYDNAGGVATSSAVSVQVKANVAPTVTLVSPPAGAGFVAPATITLSANASDTDGSVAKVEFLRGGTTAIGTVTTRPYTYTWTSVPAGTYTLTARATDDKGASTTSAPVTAKVNNPPVVTITAPVAGTRVVAPASVTVKANASDTDGSIAKVEFLGDGVLLGTDTSSPYSVVWNTPALGSHTLTARATDNLGAVKTSPPVIFSVNANQPPAITLTAPAANLQRFAGTPLTLTAAASDADGTIARVEFLFGTSVVATDITAPYSATVTVPAGSTSITAAAVDNLGTRVVSAPIVLTGVVNVPPVVTLDAPIDNAGFLSAGAADILLQASASDADGAIVRVRLMAAPYYADDTEGPAVVVATLTAPPYAAFWRGVPPVTDPLFGYRMWAEADDDAGTTSTSARALVFVSSASPWYASIVEPSGTLELPAPATVVVAGRVFYGYTNPGADPLQRVELLANGAAVAASTAPTGADGEHVFVWRNVAAGAYRLQLRVVDTLGLPSMSDVVDVVVETPNRPPTATVHVANANKPFVNGVNNASIPIDYVIGDPDGTLRSAAIVTEGPYSAPLTPPGGQVTWANVRPGVHMVSVRAADDRGLESQTPPVFLEVVNSAPPPVVALTAPAAGGVYVPGVPLTVTADAGGADPIARVDYITVENANKIGSSTVPPYRISWMPGPGRITLRAVAFSTNGRSTASVDMPVDVSSNRPPTVRLTAPRNGDEFTVGQVVTLDAMPSDADGTVSSVRFMVDGAVVGTVTATNAPYRATWTAPAPGTYALTAVVTDNQGATSTSPIVSIGVVAAVTAVNITAPAAGSSLASGSTAAITVRSVLPGHTLNQVQYLLDGAFLGNVAVNGTSVATTTFNWASPPPGTHVLTARASSADGTAVTSPPVSITVDDYAMALADPVAGQVFLLPSAIRIQAAPSATGIAIARVEFLADGAVIGTSTAPPYAWVWRGAGPGNHTVGARAIDTSGRAVSAIIPVHVASAPTVTLDGGQDNSTLADDLVTITGTVVAPRNAAVIVAGRRASLDPTGRFRIENVPLGPGANTVPVIVNTPDSAPVQRTLTVSSTGSAPFSVDLSPQDGFAPLIGTLTIRNRAQVPFARIEVDAGDDGSIDVLLNALVDGEARIDYSITGTGTFVVKVTAYDSANKVIYQARRQLRVFDRAELAGTVVGAYYTMVERLAVSDSSGAVRLFTGDAQARYADIFATLGTDLPLAAADLRRLVDGVIGEDLAELTLLRDTAQGPMLFMVYLIRGRDGIWRIESL